MKRMRRGSPPSVVGFSSWMAKACVLLLYTLPRSALAAASSLWRSSERPHATLRHDGREVSIVRGLRRRRCACWQVKRCHGRVYGARRPDSPTLAVERSRRVYCVRDRACAPVPRAAGRMPVAAPAARRLGCTCSMARWVAHDIGHPPVVHFVHTFIVSSRENIKFLQLLFPMLLL